MVRALDGRRGWAGGDESDRGGAEGSIEQRAGLIDDGGSRVRRRLVKARRAGAADRDRVERRRINVGQQSSPMGSAVDEDRDRDRIGNRARLGLAGVAAWLCCLAARLGLAWRLDSLFFFLR